VIIRESFFPPEFIGLYIYMLFFFLIFGVCILSRVYQLNIRTPLYATNVSVCVYIYIYIYSKKFYYVVRNYADRSTTIRHPRKVSVHTDTNINAPTGVTR
jgi:hypothetical protein